MIFDENIEKLYEFIGFRLKQQNYALQAITCSGFAKEFDDLNHFSLPNQDALAIVGDHAIKLILSSLLLKDNPYIEKGEMSILINEYQSNYNLEQIGKDYHLDRFLLHKNNELEGKKKYATSIEAIIGAIFLSEGFEIAKEFAMRIQINKNKFGF